MEARPLDLDQTVALGRLLEPYTEIESRRKQCWKIVTKIKLSLLLWVDMVSHVQAIVNGDEDWVEGVLTIGAFFLSNFFAYPLVRISVTESMWFNVFLMTIGLYDLKRYLDRAKNDQALRNSLMAYMDAREILTIRTLQSLYCLKANAVTDDTVNFRREIMGTLPLLVVKVYFAYMDPARCSYISILRFVIILVGFYEPVRACVTQEASLVRMLKAGNLYDVGLFGKRNFNPNILTRFSSVTAHVAVAVSMAYRLYAILFYTVIHPLAGLCQFLVALLGSITLHLSSRPVYENPPVGCATLSYHVVEVVAKLFLIRNSRQHWSVFRISFQLWILWTVLIIAEHLGSLYSCQFLLGGYVWTNDSDLGPRTACPDWLELIVEWFSFATPSSMTSSSAWDTLKESLVFTTLLTLNVVVNGAHLLYLGMARLNDSQFPALTGFTLWGDSIFPRTERWKGRQPNRLQLVWLKKMMVLTLLSDREFWQNIPPLATCCSRDVLVDWDALARGTVGTSKPPELNAILSRIQTDQSMTDQLIDFVTYVYSITNPDQATLLRQLANYVCGLFDSAMAKMTSARIKVICDILDIEPVRKSTLGR